jgi:hypothetical protein
MESVTRAYADRIERSNASYILRRVSSSPNPDIPGRIQETGGPVEVGSGKLIISRPSFSKEGKENEGIQPTDKYGIFLPEVDCRERDEVEVDRNGRVDRYTIVLIDPVQVFEGQVVAIKAWFAKI